MRYHVSIEGGERFSDPSAVTDSIRRCLLNTIGEFGDARASTPPEADYTIFVRLGHIEIPPAAGGFFPDFSARPAEQQPFAPRFTSSMRWGGGRHMTMRLDFEGSRALDDSRVVEAFGAVAREFHEFVLSQHRYRSEEGGDLKAAVEAVVGYWQLFADDLPMSRDNRRIGNALIAAIAELVKVDEPPKSQLRSALEWFGKRVAERAADAIGVAAGTGAAAAGAYAIARATGTWDELGDYVKRALGLT